MKARALDCVLRVLAQGIETGNSLQGLKGIRADAEFTRRTSLAHSPATLGLIYMGDAVMELSRMFRDMLLGIGPCGCVSNIVETRGMP